MLDQRRASPAMEEARLAGHPLQVPQIAPPAAAVVTNAKTTNAGGTRTGEKCSATGSAATATSSPTPTVANARGIAWMVTRPSSQRSSASPSSSASGGNSGSMYGASLPRGTLKNTKTTVTQANAKRAASPAAEASRTRARIAGSAAMHAGVQGNKPSSSHGTYQ